MEEHLEAIVPRSVGERLAWAAGLLGVGFTIYLVGLIVYRLFLHPLHKFPGPILNRISSVNPQSWKRAKYVSKRSLDAHGDMDTPRPTSHGNKKTPRQIWWHHSSLSERVGFQQCSSMDRCLWPSRWAFRSTEGPNPRRSCRPNSRCTGKSIL